MINSPQLSFDIPELVSSVPTGRTCSHCRTWKDYSQFHQSSKRQGPCIECFKNSAKKSNDRNKRVNSSGRLFQLTEKRCPTCKLVLPYSEFGKELKHIDGLAYQCRSCINKKAKRSYHLKPVGQKLYNTSLTYRHRVLVSVLNNRAKKKGIPGSITPSQWRDLLASYGNRCVYCGVSGDSFKLVIDHIFPLSLWNKGLEGSQFATNDIFNIVCCCEMCNSAKMDKSFIVFLGWKNGLLV